MQLLAAWRIAYITSVIGFCVEGLLHINFLGFCAGDFDVSAVGEVGSGNSYAVEIVVARGSVVIDENIVDARFAGEAYFNRLGSFFA